MYAIYLSLQKNIYIFKHLENFLINEKDGFK